NGEAFSYVVKYKGRFKEEKQYADIVVKALPDGELLRLSDVASIELDAQSYGSGAMSLGKPAVFMGVFQTKGSKDRKSTRLNSSHVKISYAVFCLKKNRRKNTSPSN